MQNNSFEYKYRESLKSLVDDKKITQNQLDHFIRRGIQSISQFHQDAKVRIYQDA